MTTSTKFGIPYIASQQATPEITHNAAMYMLEMLGRGVKDRLNVPPGAPVDGDTYLITAVATGAWAGKENHLTIWAGNGWYFLPGFSTAGALIPIGADHEGMQIYVQDENALYRWSGAAWAVAAIGTVAASAVTNTPAGNIAATDVQAAINELDTEKAGLALANTLTAIQKIQVPTDGNSPTTSALTLQSDDAGTGGPKLSFFHNSASPAANDLIAEFLAWGKDSGGNNTPYSTIDFSAPSVTDGAETGAIAFGGYSGGTFASNRLTVRSGIVVGSATGGDQGAGTANAVSYYANANLIADTNGLLRTRPYTVATLPAAGAVTGALARVSDSLAAPVYNAIAVGGGAVFAQVTSDGTNWRYC